ncbi:hypothetical protein CPLU01_13659 [Colletotrichum plurivorum]|uniref:Uncharacterized protein n=1 Tax=Colletotrichum plurivorum TaxID=2175906 RepID=A0A8H6JPZ9_9PEZI|nr:hypothetical protein CPLU01_13659 [Colletotrichum plurivorum]
MRKMQGVPNEIKVVNQHEEKITVVVSRYRPCRLVTGFNINISATGGGIGLSQTTYEGHARKKLLEPESQNKLASKATFTLWTQRDRSAVVTVFVGSEEKLHIGNDEVPAGATVYVSAAPDLRIVPHGQAPEEE